MQNKHVSTYIYAFFILILTLAISILGILIGYHSTKVAGKNVLSRLDVALKVAENQLTIRDSSIESLLDEITYYENIASLIESNDKSELDRILLHANAQVDGYYLVIDKDGFILSSQDHLIASKWEPHYLLNYFKESKKPLYTTEILSKDTVSNASANFQNQVSLPGQSDTAETAMVHLIVYPVYDNANLVGALVGGYIMNNSSDLAHSYTEAVSDTYMSIGTTEGLRICSNIDVGNFSQLAGTMQSKQLIEATNNGEYWRGKVSTNGEEAFIVSEPIFNYRGDVIGNIGVGAPAFLFPDLGYQSIVFSTTVCIALLCICALVLHYLCRILVSPIYKLQKFSRSVAANKILPDRIAWNDRFIPQEIHTLADDMMIMAQELTTENIRLEEKVKERTLYLQHTIQELENANNYKSHFLANISHELCTPLNSIIGFASLLQDEIYGKLNDKQKNYVSVIMNSSQHLLNLINDVLRVIKLENHVEKLSVGETSVTDLLQTVTASVEPMLHQKNQILLLDISPDSQGLNTQWDEQKIRQVLLNLLSNAIKFTPNGGQIRVCFRRLDTGEYVLNVIDNGIGVEDELKEKVFLAFEQADSSYTRTHQGAGLGLAISKHLIEMHGGKIWIEDNIDGGTNVCILLPADKDMTQKL